MVDRIGQQFGNYRLMRLLGKGGFAEVYLGEHLYVKRHAAVKLLHTTLGQKEFLIEAQRLIDVAHPHIIRVLDFAVEDDIPFLVIEYAPNGTLRTRYPKGSQLTLETIMSYVLQAADALQYIHDQKLVHRDIKPENMLLGAQRELLLGDFGIAAIAHTTNSLDQQGRSGTPPYMAPEQIQGKPRPASDQYALGVVVYEWLSGYPPFRGSVSEVIGQHMFASPPPLREKVPTLPSGVEEVVLKALAKDPKERFESVQLFAQCLEQAVQETIQVAVTTVQLSPITVSPPAAFSHMSTELSSTDTLSPSENTQRSTQATVPTTTMPPALPEIVTPIYSTDSVQEEGRTPDLSTRSLEDTIAPDQAPTIAPQVSPVLAPPIEEKTQQQIPEVSQNRRRAIPRRAIVAGLATLLVGGGITFIVLEPGKTGIQAIISGSGGAPQPAHTSTPQTGYTSTPQLAHNVSSNTTSTSLSGSTPSSSSTSRSTGSTPGATAPSQVQVTPASPPQSTSQPIPQPTPQSSAGPTPVQPTQPAALTLQITNCPQKVNNNSDVPVTVTANRSGVNVQLIVTYDVLSDIFRSQVVPTDNNDVAVLTWHVGLVTSVVSGLLGAHVTAVAKDQNGQQVQSQTVTVQVALSLL